MELSILKDIVIIFALSTAVNLIFTRIKVPTVVGYLLTGVIAGPYMLSLVNAQHEIELMAQIGIVLLLGNMLADNSINIPRELIILTVKVIGIICLLYVGNKWLLPKLLHLIAMTKNQELFMMSILLICFAIALLTSKLGLSLAFRAFLAGLMISESEYSHNVFGNFMPIKDVFTSFFFVSIGMLLDISFIMKNFPLVIMSVMLVIILKTIIAGGTGFILGHTLQGTVLIGLALSQVGEFSFILARLGFIVFDPVVAREKMNNGDMVLYGDAINEPILRKAHVDTADIVVISVGSIIPSMAITEKVRQLNNNAFIIVRAATIKPASDP